MPHLTAYRADGTPVSPGEAVSDFRGDLATFESADRAEDPGSDGKVTVTRDGYRATYYARVYGLTVPPTHTL